MPTQLAASMQIVLGLLLCWRRVFPTEDLRKSPIPYLFMQPECGFFLAKLWTINLAKRQRQTKQTKCNLIMPRNCLKIIFPMARKECWPSLSTIESLIKYSWNFWRATSATQTKRDGAVRRIKFALHKLEARNGEGDRVRVPVRVTVPVAVARGSSIQLGLSIINHVNNLAGHVPCLVQQLDGFVLSAAADCSYALWATSN